MKKHNNYPLIKNEFYETPTWVTEALLSDSNVINSIAACLAEFTNRLFLWEPAAGRGAITNVIRKNISYVDVYSSDIDPQAEGIETRDFLAVGPEDIVYKDRSIKDSIIITNPPFSLADAFIEKTISYGGCGLFLLRSEFETAKKRREIMKHCFYKLVLTKRPRWIADSTKSPMYNFAWYAFSASLSKVPDLFTTKIWYED